jgi:hypothetical protein
MERASQGCSRVRRDIPPGRTGRIALSSECSYRFVVCMSRVMASRSSRSGRGARCARGKRVVDALLRPTARRNGCGTPNKTQGQNLGMGAVTAFFSRRESACRRDSARECVLRRPYPGRRWACSTNEVRPFLCEEKPPPTKYEGRAVESGSESGMTGFARTTASEVPGRAFLRPSIARARSRGPWLAPKAIHTARASDTEAALVKNEGASPLTDARTDRVEEGSDDAT